jgi:hypothetical protein
MMQLSADKIAMVLAEEIGIAHLAVKLAEMGERGELAPIPAPIARPIETHPRSGRFWAWWRTERLQEWSSVVWKDGALWTACGVAVNEPKTTFSHWLPEPAPPAVNVP